MVLRILKYLGLFLLTVFILANVILGYYGVSSIILTAIFYFFIWFTGRLVLKYAISGRGRYINFTLLMSTIVVSLFVAELSVKYIFKREKYWEPRGEWFTSYPGGVPEIENLIRKYALKPKDMRFRSYRPYTEDINGGSEFKYVHRYNSLGFRGADFSVDNALNIVALGDSYTEGVGVPGDSTWAVLLENKLNRVGCLPRIQCINGGIMGTDPFYEYVMLDKILLAYHPQVVLVCVNQTDIDDVMKVGGWERFTEDGGLRPKPRPWWFLLYQCSPIARYVLHSVFHNPQLLPGHEYQVERKNAIEKLRKCITRDYLDLASAHHFKLVVILHPLQKELEDANFSLQGLADSLQKNKAITIIDLYEELRQKKAENGIAYRSLYWPIDRHNNSKGYNLWADIVCDKLLHRPPLDSLCIAR